MRVYELDEKLYRADFEVLDRYQGYSKHLSTLAAAGIAACWTVAVALGDRSGPWTAGCLFASAALFAGSIAASTYHLYASSDAMAFYVQMLRTDPAKRHEPAEGMTANLKSSEEAVKVAAVCVSVGAACFAVALLLACVLPSVRAG